MKIKALFIAIFCSGSVLSQAQNTNNNQLQSPRARFLPAKPTPEVAKEEPKAVEESTPSPWSLSLALGIAIENTNSTEANNTISSFYAIPSGSYKISEVASLSFNMLVYNEFGSYQGTTKPPSDNMAFFRFRAATVDLTPSPIFQVSSGIVPQRPMHSKLFYGSRGLPGVRINSDWVKSESYNLTSRVQQAIVTSAVQTTDTKPGENVPTLFSAGLYQTVKSGNLTGGLNLIYYQYKDLHGAIAERSFNNGNAPVIEMTEVNSKKDYRFTSGFLGYELGATLGYKWSDLLSYNFTGNYVFNQAVNSDLNDGWILLNEFSWVISPSLTLVPTYEMFMIEPAAAVSGLNDGTVTTNRAGYLAGLRFRHKNLLISARFGEREATYLSATQPKENTYKLEFELDPIKFF